MEVDSARILKKMHERIIKEFMDVIILAKLRDGPASGYDVICLIDMKFHILLSPGTVYSMLYSLERQQLIEGSWSARKRVYRLTDKGTRLVEAMMRQNTEPLFAQLATSLKLREFE
jgi:DNA-binding PadR family transcriptional regulator